jgi:PhnB protein
MAVKPIPEGQHSITPTSASTTPPRPSSSTRAFGAVEMFRLEGRVGHAELKSAIPR